MLAINGSADPTGAGTRLENGVAMLKSSGSSNLPASSNLIWVPRSRGQANVKVDHLKDEHYPMKFLFL
jgi:hypothetical protein